MDKKTFPNNSKISIFDDLNSISLTDLITEKDIPKILVKKEKCLECDKNLPIKIKKFKKIGEQVNLDEIDNDFGRCDCGKRHIDIVMTHVLKIMKEENVDLKRFNLRNGAIPLLTPLTNEMSGEYVKKNSLLILHPKLTEKIAKRILKEVSEVKGVIKGDSSKTVGMIDSKSERVSYELIEGNDIRCDIIQSPLGDIAINKIQHLSYLEFPKSMENKIRKLCDYLKTKHFTKEKISNLKIFDGTCGNGTLGIFLLKLGVKKVVFNDIWEPSTFITSINLESNGFKIIGDKFSNTSGIAFGKNFEVYNLSIEDFSENILKNNLPMPLEYDEKEYLNEKNKEKNEIKNEKEKKHQEEYNNNKFDICILDCFPNANIEDFEKIAKKIAKDVFII